MTIAVSDERKVLTPDEFRLVQKARVPKIEALSDKDLQELVQRLRASRDRARDMARRQSREIRGKAAPKGKRAARTNDSQTLKKQIFANALRRVEYHRHKIKALEQARYDLQGSAARALAHKQDYEAQQQALQEAKGLPYPDRTPSYGMQPVNNPRPTVEIDHMERGRVSQFVRNAQAKRDSAPHGGPAS